MTRCSPARGNALSLSNPSLVRRRVGAMTRACRLASLLPCMPLLFALGCGGGDGQVGPQLPTATLDLSRIEWSQALPSMSGPGHVTTVAEAGDEVAVYSDLGLFLWASGSTAGSDVSIRSWRAAAAVPALGLPGQWLIGIDGEGRIQRLRNGFSFGLEDVSARYALTGKPVREVAALGDGSDVVFATDSQLALTDGTTQKFFDLTLRNLTAAAGRLAGFDETGLRVWAPKTGTLRRLDLPSVVGIAFAPDGVLWAATAERLYREDTDGSMQVAHHIEAGQTVSGLAGSRRGLWLGISDGQTVSLALVRDGQLLLPAERLALPTGSRLLGSPSGDVWVISSDGQLSRYGQLSGGGRDLALWREKLLPLFDRYCQGCHLPNGSAHIDMTSYGSWVKLRKEVLERVVQRTPSPMPPTGAGTLTPQELADVQDWALRTP